MRLAACGGGGAAAGCAPPGGDLVGRRDPLGRVGGGCRGWVALQDRRAFEETARDWTRRFAS